MNVKMTLEEAVWVDADRMSGVPCFRGSRLPVQQLFDWLADGVPLDEFIEDFQIDRRAAEAVLRAAGAEFSELCASTDAVVPARTPPDMKRDPLEDRGIRAVPGAAEYGGGRGECRVVRSADAGA